MSEEKYQGALNMEPDECPLCGERHEVEYPHIDTPQFRRYVFREKGRAATEYDLLAHTQGMVRESVMTARLQQMVVRG